MEHFEEINGVQWFEMLVVAKSMESPIGRTKLFALLREEGIMMAGNLPYQPYVDNGCFKLGIKHRLNKDGNIAQSYIVPLCSAKGVKLVAKIVNKQKKESVNEEAK